MLGLREKPFAKDWEVSVPTSDSQGTRNAFDPAQPASSPFALQLTPDTSFLSATSAPSLGAEVKLGVYVLDGVLMPVDGGRAICVR